MEIILSAFQAYQAKLHLRRMKYNISRQGKCLQHITKKLAQPNVITYTNASGYLEKVSFYLQVQQFPMESISQSIIRWLLMYISTDQTAFSPFQMQLRYM
jgi:hypothetical protein